MRGPASGGPPSPRDGDGPYIYTHEHVSSICTYLYTCVYRHVVVCVCANVYSMYMYVHDISTVGL